MTQTLWFDEPSGDDPALVGGKGLNLGRLAKANFPVPKGFTVTTEAYADFISANQLAARLAELLKSVNYGEADQLNARAAEIRTLITTAKMPAATSGAISAFYATLGDKPFVAVRSSGTAEDLAGASFAGQHDTYLDIRGVDAVLDAVKRCWASLWTARAIAYRQRSGFGGANVGIAVVVQTMIESEVSGVMFTANPMTAAVDEYVINASWGLGEAIVAGLVTPDMFVLDRETLRVKRTTLGQKTRRIVRDFGQSYGTREEELPREDQDRACLTPRQLRELGALGARVSEYYGGFPQDTEWALKDGQFYLLQSRDVTGVDFSWDEDLDDFQTVQKKDDQVWTRSWSDATWTGAVTPLFYSTRAENAQYLRQSMGQLWGLPGYGDHRIFKYHRAFVYYGSDTDYLSLSTVLHPSFRREELMENLPPAWREKIKREPFSWIKIAETMARIALLEKEQAPWNIFKHIYEQFDVGAESANGLPPEEIRLLSDGALKKYCEARCHSERYWVRKTWTTFYFSAPMFMGMFTHIVEQWAGEKSPSVLADLLTGLPEATVTEKANHDLASMAKDISDTPWLREIFNKHPGAGFFAEVRMHKKGAEFSAKYDRFLAAYGHRGQADRDLFFDRRVENPGLDYTALSTMLDVDHEAGAQKVRVVVARREQLTKEMIAKIREQPLGELRAQAFVTLQNWLLKFWQFRDDQRGHVDRATFSMKRAFAELGRRLCERRILEGKDDFYMFSKNELFRILDRGHLDRVARAKLAARRRNYRRFRVEFNPPKYMIGDQYADLEVVESSSDANVMRGVGMSRGKTTGVARVIASQTEIGKVKKGEILVTVATDPGWTPVFVVISGLVLETGGMLAHGACISREYGIPAVQVGGAMKKIVDGALITVDGDTGQVRIHGTEEGDTERHPLKSDAA
jgi:phosphohistidine swiveling domain-containing protein